MTIVVRIWRLKSVITIKMSFVKHKKRNKKFSDLVSH